MEIRLHVLGDALFSSLSSDQDLLDLAFFKMSRQPEPVTVTLVPMAKPLRAADLLIDRAQPAVIVAEGDGDSLGEGLHTLDRRELLLASSSQALDAQVIAPLIIVFGTQSPMDDMRDFPELISDWLFAPVNISELARRALCALRRKNILQTLLRFGPITLVPDTRAITFSGRSMTLTRSEFALAEMFFTQAGSVIPIPDLVALFKSTGKSIEGSNIRVTIFQFRLKLEMLTKSLYTIGSVYKQGYCLKQKTRYVTEPLAYPHRVAQQPSLYGAPISASH